MMNKSKFSVDELLKTTTTSNNELATSSSTNRQVNVNKLDLKSSM